MAEEYSDRFQSEVLQSLQKLVAKSVEHDQKFNRIDQKFDELASQIAEVSKDLKSLDGRFNDVGVMAIKDNQRIDVLEKRVDDIETGVH